MYGTVKNKKLITINFTLFYPRCGNYPPPKREKCKEETEKFEPRQLIEESLEQF
ncbi:MAG: hypothetical protein ACQEP7_04560 [bacterium]